MLILSITLTTTEWRCHVDVIKPFHFFYDSNSFCLRSESSPRTNPLFLGAMTHMKDVLIEGYRGADLNPFVNRGHRRVGLLTYGQCLGYLSNLWIL